MAKKRSQPHDGGRALELSADPDDLKFFLEDAQDQLEQLDQSLVELEREGPREDLIQTIFRAAHTLKGSSATIGHTKMAVLTHRMETTLDAVRKGECPVTTPLVDTLLKALDALRVLTAEVTSLTHSGIDCAAIEAELEAALAAPADAGVIAGGSGAPAATAIAPEHFAGLAANARKGYSAYEVNVRLNDSCEMPAVRHFQMLLELSEGAHVVASWPAEADIEAGNVDLTFRALVSSTMDAALLQRTLGRVLDTLLIDIEPIDIDLSELPGDDVSNEIVLTAEQRELLQSNEYRGRDAYAIELRLRSDSQMPAVRLFQATMELGKVGDIVYSDPPAEAIEQGECGRTLRVVIATNETDSALRSLVSGALLDLDDLRVTPYAAGAGDTGTPAIDERSAVEEAEVEDDRRVVDLGPEARGRTQDDLLKIAAQKLNTASKSVRIDVERLDALMNLVGELVIDRTRLVELASRLTGSESDGEVLDNFAETAQRLGRIADELQDQIMKSRMLPIENVFNRFPRMVRDLAQRAGKDVEFIIEGKETELDRSVIEEIGDPLIHLLRNAIDHGIEQPDARAEAGKPRTGRLHLSASHEENYIVIRVRDDGRGIDPVRIGEAAVRKGIMTREAADKLTASEARDLLWAPGFSTAAEVTDVSGRGVGMDIVKTNIERLNGTLEVHSEVGGGTEFVVKLPLTLAIIQALLVKVADETYAVPIAAVTETLRLAPDSTAWVMGRESVQLRGTILPLLDLRHAFDMPEPGAGSLPYVVAVKLGERQLGFVVDELVGERDIVIKSLGRVLGDVGGIAGATILGNGNVALIVDVQSLVRNYGQDRVAA